MGVEEARSLINSIKYTPDKMDRRETRVTNITEEKKSIQMVLFGSVAGENRMHETQKSLFSGMRC